MLPALRRGRTTQKAAWSVRRGADSAFMRTLTITCFMSGERRTRSTVPSATDLCCTVVCPAVSPAPVRKVMVMSGPRSERVR